jgi:hypothetical protein
LILILEQNRGYFGEKLQQTAVQRGFDVLALTPVDIVYDLQISYRLSDSGSSVEMAYGSMQLSMADLEGVYSGIDTFSPELWPLFSQKDAEYAAMEWQALWQGILNSLACPVVNPPAMDALGGTLLSPPELFCRARQIGFEIPTVAEVESGEVASELAEAEGYLTYVDIGEEQHREMPMDKEALRRHPTREHHIRIREYFPGRSASIALIGKKPIASYRGEKAEAMQLSDVAGGIIEKLLKLHSSLRLSMAEYFFFVMSDQRWIFTDVMRRPSDETLEVHGDVIISDIVDIITGREIL